MGYGQPKEYCTLDGDIGVVLSIAFGPDGKTLASCGGYEKPIRLWDVASGKNTATLEGIVGL